VSVLTALPPNLTNLTVTDCFVNTTDKWRVLLSSQDPADARTMWNWEVTRSLRDIIRTLVVQQRNPTPFYNDIYPTVMRYGSVRNLTSLSVPAPLLIYNNPYQPWGMLQIANPRGALPASLKQLQVFVALLHLGNLSECMDSFLFDVPGIAGSDLLLRY
jgi:hypothetical protein